MVEGLDMNIWFTADHHFHHSNIIQLCNRPFKFVEDMHYVMIQNHNKRVAKDDVVFFLGDVSLSKKSHQIENFISQMNGTKILILGNHDSLKWHTYEKIGFHSVHSWYFLKYGPYTYNMIHDPNKIGNKPGKYWVHGHTHMEQDLKIINGRMLFNVGVEVRDYQPVHIDELANRINGLKRRV